MRRMKCFRERTLRDYQAEISLKGLGHLTVGQGLLLSLCVGSGKTLISLVIATLLFDRGLINRVLVIAPLRDIRRQFEKLSGRKYKVYQKGFPRGMVVLPEILGPKHETSQCRMDTSKKLITYFRQTREAEKLQVAVTTYGVWINAAESLSKLHEGDWSKTLIIIDEGHHIYDSAKVQGVTSHTIRVARNQGAKTIQLTGTAARYDGWPVRLKLPDGTPDPVEERSLLDQIDKGWAPGELRTHVITVPGEGRSDTDRVIGSWGMPVREKEGFALLVQDFLQCGCPLTILRIRCQGEGANKRIRKGLKKVFLKKGINAIIHTTGNSSRDQRKWEQLFDLLHPEEVEGTPTKNPTYEEIRKIANVVIVHQKLNEGIDLPAFSHLYLWGIPYSLPLLHQLGGRVMRLRYTEESRGRARKEPLYQGYPKRWVDTSRITFCTAAVQAKGSEPELMHQFGAWLHSLEVGSLLGRLARYDDRLKGVRGKAPRAMESARQEYTQNHEEVEPFMIQALAQFEELCSEKAEPLNDFSDPDKKARVIARLAQGLAADPHNFPEVKRIPQDVLERCTLLSARARVREPETLRKILSDSSPTDPGTQEIVAQALEEFVSQTRDHTFVEWALRGSLKEHYTELGKKTGVLTPLEGVLQKVEVFRLRNDGRLPGAHPYRLNQELVPGEKFCFDHYAHRPWVQELVRRAYPAKEWIDEIEKQRGEWGRYLHSTGSSQQRVRINDFRKLPENQRSPLVVYRYQALWVCVGRGFEWVEELELSDVWHLGEWSTEVSPRHQYRDDNEGVLNRISEWVKQNGVKALIDLIRTGSLDRLKVSQ